MMKINWMDRAIAVVDPERALRRMQARHVMAAYEAAKPTVLRKQSRDAGSGNRWVSQAGNNLRNQARHLDGNHDLAKGVLNALVTNTVGANGIMIEPQPRTVGGEIHDDLADSLRRLWKNWCKNPEVTGIEDWPGAQRLLARSWFRDGEAFTQDLVGNVPTLRHDTEVSFSIEMIESDMLPLSYDDPAKRIVQGIQKSGWGRPLNYYFYRNHPGDMHVYTTRAADVRPIGADFINHIATRERIGQLRGVSVFAAVMTRLDDIKDYEESERIAAKIAASMAAYIKKGNPDFYTADPDRESRSMRFQPGMFFDDLLPGEDVGLIKSDRPNPQLIEYRKGQLRAVSSGTMANYSTIARDYDGSYSSQRQELVEGRCGYQVLTADFIKSIVQPVWDTFVFTTFFGDRLLPVPADIDILSLDDALFIGPPMPWIDPKKEAEGYKEQERAGYMSGPEIIRTQGRNPSDVIEQEASWRRRLAAKELISSADPANDRNSNDVVQNTSQG
ncbi:MAG: phage portal protein [Gammaproteobacteria bacterium]